MADIRYVAELPPWQRFLIALVVVVIAVIASMVAMSDVLGFDVLGMFVQIAGVLLLSLGLVRTNDDLLYIAEHPKKKDHQGLVTQLSTERFQTMLGLFLMVLGLLFQIFGAVL